MMSESDAEEEFVVEKRVKLVLVGDSGSGKTSIAMRYCNDEFTRHYTPTAGIDFFLKTISLGNRKNVTLHIWDVGGLALHGNMLDKYIFEAHVILFVYDVTNSSSFDILGEWIGTTKRLNESLDSRPVMAIIGNKCDVEHQRTVKREKSYKFSAENGIPCHDVSAKSGESISVRIASLIGELMGIRLTKTDKGFYKPIIQPVKINDDDDDDDDESSTKPKESSSFVAKRLMKKQMKKFNKTESNSAPISYSKSSVCSLQ